MELGSLLTDLHEVLPDKISQDELTEHRLIPLAWDRFIKQIVNS